MEWTVARCDRPSTPPPVQRRAARNGRTAAVPSTALAASWSHSPGALPPREMRWPLTPQPVLPHCLLYVGRCYSVDTDRRAAVIRFMVILIALSIAQFLTLAATVSPSDTHI
jgi:hypothetical protein